MELTKNQKLLIALFKELEMSKELVAATMIAIKTPEKTEKLIDYILEISDKGEELNKDRIINRALEISQGC